MKDQKILLFGVSAIAWILGATHSIHSRSSRNENRRRRRSNLQTATDNTDIPLEQIKSPISTHKTPASNGNIGLLIHGSFACILLLLSPHLKPPHYQLDTWKQHIGAVCIISLLLHVIITLLRRCISSSATARSQRQLSSSITTTAQHKQLESFNGLWIKDKNSSDSMDGVCDLMHIHGIVRLAIGLIKGVELKITPPPSPASTTSETLPSSSFGEFKLSVLSGILWFKINESFPLGGPEVRHSRRDLRRGPSFGQAKESSLGGVEIHHRFDDPNAGVMDERFHCPDENTLYVDTTVVSTKNGESVSYRQVYRRKIEE